MKHDEFYSMYFNYVRDNTEAAFVYHRWSMLVVLAAHMGANIKIPMGHFNLVPNFYVQLVGGSGTRKSSAIKVAVDLGKELDKINISPDQISKEALISYMSELSAKNVASEGVADILKGLPMSVFTDMLIPADEFSPFVGDNKDAYMLMLSQLYDGKEDGFHKRSVTGGSMTIENPYVNLISGNTYPGFADVFSGKAVSMGMLTRMLVIPWHDKRRNIAFPPAPDLETKGKLLEVLDSVYTQSGTVKYSIEAQELLSELYEGWRVAMPIGMEQYKQRRFSHLVKLCAIMATIEKTLKVSKDIVYNCNTMLASNEHHMSDTFGFVFATKDVGVGMEFAYDYLKEHRSGATLGELMEKSTNVCQASALQIGLNELVKQNKVKVVGGESGAAGTYIYIKQMLSHKMRKYLNLEFLTGEERKMMLIQGGE